MTTISLTSGGCVVVNGSGGAGYLDLFPQSSAPATPASNVCRQYADATGRSSFILSSGNTSTFDTTGNSGNQTYTYPNTSDTFAMLAFAQTLTNKTITDPSNNVAATSLLISGGSVNVSSASAPSAGQALVATSASTSTWQLVNDNVGLSTSVGSNALTITLTQSNGSSAPSSTNPTKVNFRSATATTGAVMTIMVTSSVSITIPSGTTIGTSNSYAGYIYVYALNSSGTVLLAVSLAPFALDASLSTTAISGGSTATVLYSTAAQTNLPVQYLGKILAPQATAGTWASNSTEIYVKNSYDYAAGRICKTRGDIETIGSSNLPSAITMGVSSTFLSTTNGLDGSWNPLNLSASFTGNALGTPLGLATTGVAAASYGAPNVTFNSFGQATAASNILTTKGDIMVYDTVTDRFAVGTDGYELTSLSGATAGISWLPGDTTTTRNLSISTSVAASALTVTLQSGSGAALSATNPGFIWFRNSTLATGSLSQIVITSNVTITIPSGTTLGAGNSYSGFLYVYGLNSSGSVVLGLGCNPFATDALLTTTAISGGVNRSLLYTTSVQTSVPVVYLGKFIAPQTVAGTWVSNATEIYFATGFDYAAGRVCKKRGDVETIASGQVPTALSIGVAGTILSTTDGIDITWNTMNIGTGLTGNGISTTLDLSNTTVTAASYGAPNVTFNSFGQATAASNILTTKGDIMVYDTVTDRLAVGTDGYALVAASGSTPGLVWTPPTLAGVQNICMSVNASSNALTIQLHQANLSSLSSATPGYIWFRNATLSTGSLASITLTSGPTLTIPSGTTIGTSNSYAGYIYVYAMNNAGSVVLGVSLSPLAVDNLVSSSAISGGSSATTLYSTSAHSTLATVYLGKFLAPQTVAGTWATGHPKYTQRLEMIMAPAEYVNLAEISKP